MEIWGGSVDLGWLIGALQSQQLSWFSTGARPVDSGRDSCWIIAFSFSTIGSIYPEIEIER